jgi:hypothetical protein
MSNDVAVQWGRQIRYCDLAIQNAVAMLGAQKVAIPCEQTKVHTKNISTSDNVKSFQAARERDTIERVRTGDKIATRNTDALEGRLSTKVKMSDLAAENLEPWKPEREIIELEHGVATDGSKVEVAEELECAALDGAVLMLLKVTDGYGKESFRLGLGLTDRAGNPILDDGGEFLDPKKKAAYEAFLAKTLEMQEERMATDVDYKAEVDDAMLLAAQAAGLNEVFREPIGGTQLEHVVYSNDVPMEEPAATPKSRSAGES